MSAVSHDLAAFHFDAAKQLARKAAANGRRRYTLCYALMSLKLALRLRDVAKAGAR